MGSVGSYVQLDTSVQTFRTLEVSKYEYMPVYLLQRNTEAASCSLYKYNVINNISRAGGEQSALLN